MWKMGEICLLLNLEKWFKCLNLISWVNHSYVIIKTYFQLTAIDLDKKNGYNMLIIQPRAVIQVSYPHKLS